MWHGEASPVGGRERGLQRLRRWTASCVAIAAGLTLVFAFLAAATFPGRSTASAADTSSQPSGGQGVQSTSGDQGFAQPTPPPAGFFGRGGSGAGARSGGS